MSVVLPMEPTKLREVAQVLVLVWLSASLVALAVLYAVHLIEQHRTGDKQRDSRRWGARPGFGAPDADGSRVASCGISAKRHMKSVALVQPRVLRHQREAWCAAYAATASKPKSGAATVGIERILVILILVIILVFVATRLL